jgi:hypothetical protein
MGAAAVNGLLGASWHALSHRKVLGGCTAAAALVLATAPWLDRPGAAVPVLRGAAVLLACAVAFAVDDAAASILAASPTTLRRRLTSRIALAGALAATTWSALVLLATARADAVPAGALSLEAATLGAIAVAAAAGLHTWHGITEPAVLTAPLVLGAVLAANLLPPDWALLAPDPSVPGWQAAHYRWAGVLALAAVTLVVASRDRAAGQRRWSRPGRCGWSGITCRRTAR